jgi:4-carboxymuconolactone decarboxylase
MSNGDRQSVPPADGGPPSEAYRRGVERRERIVGTRGNQRRRIWAALHPDLERFILEVGWGGVLSRPGLDEKTRELVTLGILLALGRDREVTTHFHGALNVGLTQEELAELLMHTSIYAGVPAMVNGSHLLAEVLRERGMLEVPEE